MSEVKQPMLSDFLFYKSLCGDSGGSGGGWNVIYHTPETAIGLPAVENGIVLYKVSEDMPTEEQILSGFFGYRVNDSSLTAFNISDMLVSDFGGIIGIGLSDNDLVLMIVREAVPDMGLSETGIYIAEIVIESGGALLVYPAHYTDKQQS